MRLNAMLSLHVIYMHWKHASGGLSLNVKTSGQSGAISSDALLTLAPADECGVSHE